jgi:hypothetical protein
MKNGRWSAANCGRTTDPDNSDNSKASLSMPGSGGNSQHSPIPMIIESKQKQDLGVAS